MRTVVAEEAPLPAEEVAVDGSGRAAREAPRAAAIVRQRGVRVVQVRYHHEPVRDEYPGHAVERGDARTAEARTSVREQRSRSEEAEIRRDDNPALRGVKYDGIC